MDPLKKSLLAQIKTHADSVYDHTHAISVGKPMQANLVLIDNALMQITLALYKLVDILSGETDSHG